MKVFLAEILEWTSVGRLFECLRHADILETLIELLVAGAAYLVLKVSGCRAFGRPCAYSFEWIGISGVAYQRRRDARQQNGQCKKSSYRQNVTHADATIGLADAPDAVTAAGACYQQVPIETTFFNRHGVRRFDRKVGRRLLLLPDLPVFQYDDVFTEWSASDFRDHRRDFTGTRFGLFFHRYLWQTEVFHRVRRRLRCGRGA